MIPARTVVLDNEAVQALADPAHRKHRKAIAVAEVVAGRNLRRAGSTRLVVPTAVRVEAGWDRQAARNAPLNRLRMEDAELDTATADRAARAASALRLSVADAHVAAVLDSSPGPHVVLTSDVRDMSRIAAHVDTDVRVVRL